MSFSIAALSLPTEPNLVDTRKPLNAPTRFIKGPISYEWLALAAKQPGKSLHVAMILMFQRGVQRNDTVSLSQRRLREFGVSRGSSYIALKSLENAGLVTVVRKNGALAQVTLISL